MGVVLEEADETLFWLEMLVDSNVMDRQQLCNLMSEGEQLVRIFSASLVTARKPRAGPSSSPDHQITRSPDARSARHG